MVHPLPIVTASDESVKSAVAAVLPIGSYEQHGSFLPLSTDTLIAAIIGNDVATSNGLLILPPITISCSHEHAQWRGTVSVRASTLYSIVNDVIQSLAATGIGKLLIVSGHGGNYVLSNVVQEASVTGANVALFPTSEDWRAARKAAGMAMLEGYSDMHGGELETSILLHSLPDVVRPGYETSDSEMDGRPNLLLTLGMAGYTKSGIIGRPSAATAQKGAAALAELRERAAAHLVAIGVTPESPDHRR
jgi:creatinine amidohydrolase